MVYHPCQLARVTFEKRSEHKNMMAEEELYQDRNEEEYLEQREELYQEQLDDWYPKYSDEEED
jgi:hypothetical protein